MLTLVSTDCFVDIISFCDLSSLFCLQFVSVSLRKISRKYYKAILYETHPREYQKTISNSAVEHGMNVLLWIDTLYSNWVPPSYCYARNIETLEWIKAKTLVSQPPHIVEYINKYCPSRDIIEWMIKNHLLFFSLEEVAKQGYYDILEKCRDKICTEFPNYDVICWEIDTRRKIRYNYDIIPFLVGGGKIYIQGVTASTDGCVDTSYFVCRNVGAKRLKWAYNHGYRVNIDAFYSAVESNNIEALDYLKIKFNFLILNKPENALTLLDIAIEENHYNAVKWVLSNYEISRQRQLLCSNIKILLCLKEHGFIWDASTYINAILNRDINTIKYLCENGVPWICDKELMRWGTSKNMRYTLSEYLAEAGDVDIMKWCLANGCPLTDTCCEKANDINMIIYLISIGCPPNSQTIASSMQNVNTIKWLINYGIKPDDDTICRCQCYGSYAVKRWLGKYEHKINIADDINNILA
jgi:hypothetical protein